MTLRKIIQIYFDVLMYELSILIQRIVRGDRCAPRYHVGVYPAEAVL